MMPEVEVIRQIDAFTRDRWAFSTHTSGVMVVTYQARETRKTIRHKWQVPLEYFRSTDWRQNPVGYVPTVPSDVIAEAKAKLVEAYSARIAGLKLVARINPEKGYVSMTVDIVPSEMPAGES